MNKIAKATITLMIVTIIAKLLGFAREIVLASTYGTSSYSDAYLVALNIPNVIIATIGQAIITTFIPLYYEINNKKGKQKCDQFVNNLISIIVIISIVLSMIGIIFADSLVKVFAIGFKGATFTIAVKATKIFMISTVFLSLSYLMTGFLQANDNFTIPGLMSLPYNIIVIISILLSTKYGPNIMIWGTLLGISSQILFMLPFAIKNGLRYKLYLNLNDAYIKKMMKLVLPVLISVFANQLNVMLDRTLASTLSEGSVSALNYANKLNLFVTGLFITSILSVIYPKLSKLSSLNDSNKFNIVVMQTINIIILLIIPITGGIISLSTPIVSFLFERGAFDQNAVQKTSIALVFYSLGLIGIALKDLLRRVFFSLKDTKTPMINSTIAIIINIILNIILIRFMGHSGLALSTSIAAVITTLLLFKDLMKKIGNFGINKIIKLFIKSTIATFIMAYITQWAYNYTSNILSKGIVGSVVSLLTSILVGIIVYLISIIIFRVEEVSIIIDIIKSKSIKVKKIA